MPCRLAKTTYLVGSGKGGVGKSTVTVNLAVALAQRGFSVGVLDADVYGPSIPIMLGLRRLSPQVQDNRVVPFSKFGIRSISIGFFMEESLPSLWRGPMLTSALWKMIGEVNWGDLDYLLIDLPPGTGDVPMSLAQLLETDGALIVCTPQEVAMVDAIKAINALDRLGVPLLGIIENMAGFRPPGSTEIHHIFGQGKAAELAKRFQTQLLGSIPLIPAIGRGGDEGIPAAFHTGDNDAGAAFHEIVNRLIGAPATV